MEVCGGLGVRLDRKSSIESEPRTLTNSQFQGARDAALYVVNTRSIEEAENIFTQGLEPVVSVAQGRGSSMDLEGEFICIRPPLQLPDGIRDVVSAPF
ncbi:uncharacterized protein LOC8259154 [Ricinus communis]|uniref:Uncharacterized protein n=1 Tax=Ricinus communis TaxID=3988 RepID=B9RU44_RICCO|nr:uncharacterized protein LOC8259154 [Ricinus communis]EEF45163.1 conserved hypothetical protein [Ricinus communis]|eukprot:XP_002517263.1 uncharacterized protein LOC8259154 [Ricinus communis]